MHEYSKVSRVWVAAGLTIAVLACGDSPTASTDGVTALFDVQPTPGAVDVSVGASVVITFDHALAGGMEAYAVLHQGDVSGPLVEGAWMLSADRTVLTFTPLRAFEPATTYTIHLGAGMMDQAGQHVDLEAYGMGQGGTWATESMMTSGGMMNGGQMGNGMGTGGTVGMMGEGWAHPSNGTYGMLFTFTTAG